MNSKQRAKQGNSGTARSNLKELAQHLELSQTTVSRVLNGSGSEYRISEETQRRVIAAAQKLNYKASTLARSLRSKRTKTVGVMVPEISEGYATAVLGGIEDVLQLADYFYFV